MDRFTISVYNETDNGIYSANTDPSPFTDPYLSALANYERVKRWIREQKMAGEKAWAKGRLEIELRQAQYIIKSEIL
jgi:hypothetical protein